MRSRPVGGVWAALASASPEATLGHPRQRGGPGAGRQREQGHAGA